MDFISIIVTSFQQGFVTASLLLVLFGTLSYLTPCNPQQRWNPKGVAVDALYYFIAPLFTRIVQSFYIIAGASLIFYGESEADVMHYIKHGFGPLGALPLWAQAAIAFILSDIILYWTHRWFHTSKMWPFHAIHHSSEQLDWYSTYRFHPINVWLSFSLVNAVMVFLGLSIESILIMGVFNTLYSGMVHANLNWTFGKFKYIFASPVFHRWHHTTQAEGLDKNFAPTFPLLDVMFGTFYMPEGRLPEKYGITDGNVPDSFLGQLMWPFKQGH
jgi:sterol desaturase/sphingolipid hydroxylase (fatty acid hydroxylase superfamily)